MEKKKERDQQVAHPELKLSRAPSVRHRLKRRWLTRCSKGHFSNCPIDLESKWMRWRVSNSEDLSITSGSCPSPSPWSMGCLREIRCRLQVRLNLALGASEMGAVLCKGVSIHGKNFLINRLSCWKERRSAEGSRSVLSSRHSRLEAFLGQILLSISLKLKAKVW